MLLPSFFKKNLEHLLLKSRHNFYFLVFCLFCSRPARENIFSKHVAHVLNDETQRKYIQGLKRLLTKSQQYYPTDPSRSIDFVRKEGESSLSKDNDSDDEQNEEKE